MKIKLSPYDKFIIGLFTCITLSLFAVGQVNQYLHNPSYTKIIKEPKQQAQPAFLILGEFAGYDEDGTRLIAIDHVKHKELTVQEMLSAIDNWLLQSNYWENVEYAPLDEGTKRDSI